jgi:hypothetical protein
MARMIPDSPPEHPTERRVYLALRDGLGDDWTVFHSVRWQSERFGRQGDGEADFVLLHRKGLIFTEVKGGAISIRGGKWSSTSRDGSTHDIPDPFLQCLDSRKTLSRYIEDRVPGVHPLRSGHSVCFPDIRVESGFGPEAPREIVIDSVDMKQLETTVGRIVRHWGLDSTLSSSHIKAIRDLLAPTVSVRPLLADALAGVERELIRLTEQQVAILQGLRSYRRMLITGAAGTGKTILATARARRLAEDGFQVLLLCFNEPLGQLLKREFDDDPRVTATHLHSFAVGAVTSAGLKVPQRPDSRWWSTELPEALQSATGSLQLGFSALVIDEGQDFHPNWWVALQLLMDDPEEAPFYVFADAAQQLYVADWAPPFEVDPYHLVVNCRNTLQIASCVSRTIAIDMPVLGAEGPTPQFAVVKREDAIVQRVAKIVTNIEGQGFRGRQIAVLTTSAEMRDSLVEAQFSPTNPDDSLDDDVTVETVHRFKGLEADVVVYVPCGPRAGDRALAYVGMSRAKLVLIVVGTAETKSALNWA